MAVTPDSCPDPRYRGPIYKFCVAPHSIRTFGCPPHFIEKKNTCGGHALCPRRIYRPPTNRPALAWLINPGCTVRKPMPRLALLQIRAEHPTRDRTHEARSSAGSEHLRRANGDGLPGVRACSPVEYELGKRGQAPILTRAQLVVAMWGSCER